MSGLKGALDDAYTHAYKLRTALDKVRCNGRIGVATLETANAMFDAADDLASRISNLSNQLRET